MQSYVLEVPDVDTIKPCAVVVLFLFCFIVTWICVVVSVILLLCILCVFLSMCHLCLTVLVNCLLNAFAICVGEVNVFSLNFFFGCVRFC